MNLLHRCFFGLATALAAVTPAAFSATLDQVNNPQAYTGPINTNSTGLTFQQTVKVGISGILDSVRLNYADNSGRNQRFQPLGFFVNRGIGWQTDANDFYTVVDSASPDGFNVVVDVSAAKLYFTKGDFFEIGIVGLGPDRNCCSGLLVTTRDTYKSGELWLNGAVFSGGYDDLTFATYVTAVPEPSTLSLVGIGIGGLLAFARVRRKRQL